LDVEGSQQDVDERHQQQQAKKVELDDRASPL
jgi:hypothetical protein